MVDVLKIVGKDNRYHWRHKLTKVRRHFKTAKRDEDIEFEGAEGELGGEFQKSIRGNLFWVRAKRWWRFISSCFKVSL